MKAAILTWNVNGLGTSWRELVSIVDELHPDVVCLQETKHPNPFPTLPGYECFSSPFQRVHHHGSAMYVRTAMNAQEIQLRPELTGHVVAVQLPGGAVVVSMYTKNSGNPENGDNMRQKFDEIAWSEIKRIRVPDSQLVVAGDLNCCLELGDHFSGKMNHTYAGQKPYEIATLKREMSALGLHDTYMHLNPNHTGERWTYWSLRFGSKLPPRGGPYGKGWRLDYVLCTMPVFKSAEVLPTVTSDHRPIVLY